MYWACSDAAAGVQYGREHNIHSSYRLHRLYNWFYSHVCPSHVAIGIMAAAAAILALASAGLLMRGGA